MNGSEVNRYIESLVPERSELLQRMETYAHEHQIPIMELVGIETMLQLLKVHKPKSVLEIGTAIGYSAIRMAEVLPKSQIITIERDQERHDQALKFIKEAKKSEQISVIYGDALELVNKLEKRGPFDVLFIDAAKGQYERFFDEYAPLVNHKGMVISDNILFRGLVTQEQPVEKRLRSMVKKLRNYNEKIMSHPEYETRILPVGDGIALSIKR